MILPLDTQKSIRGEGQATRINHQRACGGDGADAFDDILPKGLAATEALHGVEDLDGLHAESDGSNPTVFELRRQIQSASCFADASLRIRSIATGNGMPAWASAAEKPASGERHGLALTSKTNERPS